MIIWNNLQLSFHKSIDCDQSPLLNIGLETKLVKWWLCPDDNNDIENMNIDRDKVFSKPTLLKPYENSSIVMKILT